ncbi:AMP-dependent synthetase/ligase [Micrococcus sp.]|uniref:AMP-dependent synthetase/ligase n=1 Tax=Micrococcus sp. TaxID=1271 RepID=UPI002A90A182|nr:AMP-binding protein [Micrococcus sp.]MDY6055980.1 AMP-binding protein [Micrococcus sp.]
MPSATSRRRVDMPTLVDAVALHTVTDILEQRAADTPDAVVFQVRHPAAPLDSPWRPVTAAFREQVRALAKGLIALGIQPGDHVAIAAPTRYEWTLMDLAVLYAGGVVVPLFDTAPPTQMAAVADVVGIRAAFAGDPALAATLRDVVDARPEALHGPHGSAVYTLDDAPSGDLRALARLGEGISEDRLEQARRARGLDDVATVVFTSGTTGAPKGRRILHRSFVHQVLNVAAAYRGFVHPGGSTVLFLPLAHMLSRAVQMICLHGGMTVAHVADPKAAVPAMGQIRPTFVMVVPRVLERIDTAAADKAEQARLGGLWRRARAAAVRRGRAILGEDGPVDLRTRAALVLYEAVFYRRIRAQLGGQVSHLLCGAAKLDPDLLRLFTGMGLTVFEGYGLTETTAPAVGHREGDVVPGTVGLPLPGMSVRIADDGEVQMRGPGVFAGYTDEAETAAAFDGEWFRTGDLGRLDDAGRLTVTGRIKDVVVTSNGKTINPAAWEWEVELHPAVGHAVVIGDGLAHPTAMILLDREALASWLQRALPDWHVPEAVSSRLRGGAETAGRLKEGAERMLEVTEQRIRESVGAAVEAANAKVPAPERLRSFSVLLPDAAELASLLTPTQKLRRPVLAERIAHLLPKR